MRFRAVIAHDAMAGVHGVMSSLERIESGGKRVKRRAASMLSKQGWALALVPEGADMLGFAELRSESFEEFRVESLSDNCIYMQFGLEHIVRALASAKGAARTTLKLAKRHGCATLVVEFEGRDIARVAHDIPVRIVHKDDVAAHQPPDLPAPGVILELPKARIVKTVIDRLKSVGDRNKGEARYVDVKLERSGRLSLKVVTDAAVIKTFFDDLQLSDSTHPASQQESSLVRVDSRHLAQSLQCYTLAYDTISCCPIDDHALVIHALLAQGELSFYLPVHITGDVLPEE